MAKVLLADDEVTMVQMVKELLRADGHEVFPFTNGNASLEAIETRAYNYLKKPFKLDELKLCIQRALSYSTAISENVYLRKQLKKKYQFSQIVGNSAKMHEVFKMIERVADTDSTILILGESGTGKELVAKALHFNSRRQFSPFVPVN